MAGFGVGVTHRTEKSAGKVEEENEEDEAATECPSKIPESFWGYLKKALPKLVGKVGN